MTVPAASRLLRACVALATVVAATVVGVPAAGAATVAVSGRVTLPGGGPAAGFEISVVTFSDGDYWEAVSTTLTDADGNYTWEVDGPGWPGTPLILRARPTAAEPFVAATYHGGATRMQDATTVVAPAGSVTGVDIEAIEAGVISGRVTYEGGVVGTHPRVGVTGSDEPRWVDVAVDGTYSVPHLAPGDYVVEASRRDPVSHWTTASYPDGTQSRSESTPVSVRAGETNADVDITVAQHLATLQPVVPARLVDTRPGRPHGVQKVAKQRLGGATSLRLDVAEAVAGGALPFPATDGSVAVALNLTVVSESAYGYVSMHPCGAGMGLTSSANFRPGTTRANAVVAPLPGPYAQIADRGKICITASSPVHVIIDVSGWFPKNGAYNGVWPQRVLDTRAGRPAGTVAVTRQRIGPTRVLRVELAGTSGVPDDEGVAAVGLNLTAVGPSSPGYVTAYPCDAVSSPRPASSSLNFAAMQSAVAVSNSVIVAVGQGAGICFYASSPVDLVVDIAGWVAPDRGVQVLPGTRIADTRPGRAPHSTPKQTVGGSRVLTVATGARPAANLNVTVVAGRAPGYVTVYPCGARRPDASNINFGPGEIVANMVLSKVSTSGTVCVYSSTAVDVVVDLAGRIQGGAAYDPDL